MVIWDTLAAAVACFQGARGDTPLAVDFRRIKLAWKMELPAEGALLIRGDTDARSAAEDMLTRIESLLERFQLAVQPLLPKLQSHLSDDDSASLGASLLQQLEHARRVGLFVHTSTTYEQTKQAVEKLSNDEARAFIRQALAFTPPEATAKVEARIVAWASLNMEQVVRVQEGIKHLDETFKELERAVEAKIKNAGGGDISEILASLTRDLEFIMREHGQ
jgi:hypothetical protein